MDEDDEGDEAECFLHFYLDEVALDDDGMLSNHGGHGGAREGERESKEREQVEEWVGERERSWWASLRGSWSTREGTARRHGHGRRSRHGASAPCRHGEGEKRKKIRKPPYLKFS